LNSTRFPESDHGETDRREVAERAESLDAGAQILNLGHGKRRVVVAQAGRALANVNQSVFVAVHERLEQHPAHQREYGRVGADTQP
jgi:hypothetical protein